MPSSSSLLLISALLLGALASQPLRAAGQEEVVDLDELEDDAPKKAAPKGPGEPTRLPDAALPKLGGVVEEVVDLDTIDEVAAVGVPEYDRQPWLGLLPLLPLLVLMWNVDWREGRVKAEISSARARLAPKKKAGADPWRVVVTHPAPPPAPAPDPAPAEPPV